MSTAGSVQEAMNYKTPHKIITSYIDPTATLGEGTLAWHFSRILAKVRIGRECSIGGGTEIGRGCVIGDYSRIGANVFLPPNSQIGEHVFIGPNVTCTDDRHPHVPLPGEPAYDARPPVIEDFAAVGAGAVLLPGVRIGRYARVAAGAIVTKDVPAHAMVRCEPAREQVMPVLWQHAIPA